MPQLLPVSLGVMCLDGLAAFLTSRHRTLSILLGVGSVIAAANRPRRYASVIATYSPDRAAFAEEVGDESVTSAHSPALGWIEWTSGRLRVVQRARVHLYLLYILSTLMALLVWGLGLQR